MGEDCAYAGGSLSKPKTTVVYRLPPSSEYKSEMRQEITFSWGEQLRALERLSKKLARASFKKGDLTLSEIELEQLQARPEDAELVQRLETVSRLLENPSAWIPTCYLKNWCEVARPRISALRLLELRRIVQSLLKLDQRPSDLFIASLSVAILSKDLILKKNIQDYESLLFDILKLKTLKTIELITPILENAIEQNQQRTHIRNSSF